MNRSILDEVHFSPEKGAFFYKDVRYLLIRPETLAAFQKAIEKELGPKSSRILFQSGFQGGSLSSKKYREVFRISDLEIVKFMVEMGPQIGWGRFQLEDFDTAKKRLVVRVDHSPFAEAYGPSPVPVCHLIRGVLSGTASVVFGKEVEGEESACIAKGDSFCRFEVM
jgi:predicted hydrocarbon binding protein